MVINIFTTTLLKSTTSSYIASQPTSKHCLRRQIDRHTTNSSPERCYIKVRNSSYFFLLFFIFLVLFPWVTKLPHPLLSPIYIVFFFFLLSVYSINTTTNAFTKEFGIKFSKTLSGKTPRQLDICAEQHRRVFSFLPPRDSFSTQL